MKIKEYFTRSIRAQLVGSVVLILAVIVVFVSVYYPLEQRSTSMQTMRSQVSTLSDMLSFSVGMGLGESNFNLVQTAFKWAQNDKNVTYISIQDNNNAVIVTYNPGNLKLPPVTMQNADGVFQTSNGLTAYSTVKYNGNALGKIILVYSLSRVNSEINQSTFLSVGIIMGIFLIGVLVVLWLTKLIIRQINKLNEAVGEVAGGNLNVTIDSNSKDEIGILANSFSKMTQSIKDANDLLMKERDSISQKVEEAVRESEEQKKYLSESVEKILHKMESFADGNLAVRLDIEKDDEIGRLFSGFNQAVENIRNMLVKVSESVSTTASASNEISSSAEQMSAGAQEQSAQAAEVASGVEEMTKTIMETTRNASVAAEAAKNAGAMAKDGGKVVTETIEGMNRIAAGVRKAAETVQTLGRNSGQIGEIIQVIDDIADQTNLLALNAAIEAARAGEYGRGFAVVADEVRKLAERTTKATKEIAAMIKQIQSDTSGAVSSMDEGTQEVEKGRLLADKAGESLKNIIRAAEKVVDVVTQVAAASEEQSSAAEQISKNIEAISNVAQESASGVQQIAHSSEDLNRLTLNLQGLISQFKIDGSDDSSSNDRPTSNSRSDYAVRSNGKLVKS